jgi:hypothetical protein
MSHQVFFVWDVSLNSLEFLPTLRRHLQKTLTNSFAATRRKPPESRILFVMAHKHKRVHVHTPPWATRLYIVLALVLIPWTVYLSITLPEHHLSEHWDLSWAGLDGAMSFSLLMTGILAYRKSRLVVISAAIAGTLTLVDAWFDVVSERPGWELEEALFLALCIEVPLSIISFALAYHTLKRNLK